MERSRILIGLLLAAGLTANHALAQRTTTAEPPNNNRFGIPGGIARVYQDYIYGVIGKIGKHSIVLDHTKVGIPQTITLNRKTKFVRDGKRSSAEHFKVGDPVYVDLKTDKKTGIMLAKKVLTGTYATGTP